MIILICGQQGSGKTTLSNSLILKIPGLKSLKFASPLYEMHHSIYKILEDYGLPTPDKIDGTLLQDLGEWVRKTKGQDFFVNIMKNQIQKFKNQGVENFVIDDCRFENEFFGLQAVDSLLRIKLVCPENIRMGRAAKWRINTTHSSETSLNHINENQFDFIFPTDGDDLNESITTMGEKIMKKVL